MALGWTVLVLFAFARGGLAEAALYNAAMLVGIVLSAPVTGWLSRRLHGRGLLRGAAGVELALRVGLLTGLLFGLPAWLIATGIVVMHIAAWSGFAAMRAEVNAVDASPRAMTRYALSIAAVEAVGTGLAALLPSGPDGYPTGLPLVLVFIVYAGSLIPTFRAARRARTTPWGPARPGRPATPRGLAARNPLRTAGRLRLAVSPKVLAAGGAIMLLASGPTLLAVPLTTELHGRTWVAGVAIAFSLGCLLSTMAVELIGKMQVPAALRWSLWGLGMLVGWIYAPMHAVIILLAQFLAGLSQTAFEGDMDSRVAEDAPPEAVTTALAYSASTRALGGAIAVKLLPMMVTAEAVGRVASGAMLILGVSALTIWAATSIPRLLRTAAPEAT
jgi:hypothetical protein